MGSFELIRLLSTSFKSLDIIRANLLSHLVEDNPGGDWALEVGGDWEVGVAAKMLFLMNKPIAFCFPY